MELLGGLTILTTFFSIIFGLISALAAFVVFSINGKLGKLVKEQQRTNQILGYLAEATNKKGQSAS